MTTPNEELIERLHDWHNTSAEQNRLDMQKAADLLQSQSERIAELEVIVASHGELDVEQAKHIACMESDLDTLRAQLAEIAATEPVAWMSPGKERLEFSRKDTVYGSHTIALFTHPMPAQRLTELKLLMLTTAYEQGVGKGIQRRDCNPYAADTDEHAAWKLGYEEGLDKPMPAQDAETGMINLPEPVAWLANYGGNVYTEAQLKQAVSDAQDVNAELVEALEALIESTSGVDQVSVVNDARTALSKYKGANK